MNIEGIYDFITEAEPILLGELTPNADLHDDLGITGDDFSRLMHRFGSRFGVDMRDYRWYFHHPEQGALGLGGIFKRSPSFRVPHIPVTPNLMLQAVTEGCWPLDYPEHDLTARRIDITVDRVIALAVILFLLVWLSHQS
jgi:hypothetical protein